MSKRAKEILRISIGVGLFVIACILGAQFTAVLYGSYLPEPAAAYPILALLVFGIPYLVLGYPVLRKACRNIAQGHVFDENFLMGVATIGALCLGEFPEAIAVMLFYQIGELFEDYAVDKSRDSIAEMMDICPDTVTVERDNMQVVVDPEEVEVGSIIVIKPGERVALDGVVVEGESELDTAALTGESLPRQIVPGAEIHSGSINLSHMLRVRTTKVFEDSTVSRIMELVENAADEKAPMENFITRFARYYTPIVCGLALAIAVIPPFFTGFDWANWIERGLIFLVVSCPCALVISIPLGFFGGIGGASRHGIMIKGSNYLEALYHVRTVLFDKTGTLTQGQFQVSEVRLSPEVSSTILAEASPEQLLEYVALAESYTTHPIGISVKEAYESAGNALMLERIETTQEIAGQGIACAVDGHNVLVGNARLMESYDVETALTHTSVTEAYLAKALPDLGDTTVLYTAVDGVFWGVIVVEDALKPTSARTITELKELGITQTVMLTGDRKGVAAKIAAKLGLDAYHADLLPQDKMTYLVSAIDSSPKGEKVAFVGDGINDAPALIRSDVGIAMGALGSDAAIEAADVVLMDDDPERLVTALKVSRKTMRIVYTNIVFALAVKFIVLILAALGLATMWLAIFADVGVSVIAIINAMRTLRVNP